MSYTVETTEAFDDWLEGLTDPVGREAVVTRIVRMEAGLFGDAAPVGDKVSELRIHVGLGYRVYFTKVSQRVVILLSGGDKGSQKRNISRAEALAAQI
jgi:putative addiction module killer protein